MTFVERSLGTLLSGLAAILYEYMGLRRRFYGTAPGRLFSCYTTAFITYTKCYYSPYQGRNPSLVWLQKPQVAATAAKDINVIVTVQQLIITC